MKRDIWYGSFGPYPFEDTSTYPDGAYREGARIPQVYLEDEPTELYHAATRQYVDVAVGGGSNNSLIYALIFGS